MTFLEKLESGYFTASRIDPLNVGEEGGYPEYKRGELLTSQKYNEVTHKVDEIAKKTNVNVQTIFDAISALSDDIIEISDKIQEPINVDNNTLWIDPETGKLSIKNLPRIKSSEVDYYDPDTGQYTGMNIGRALKNVQQVSVIFENKGTVEDYN